MKTNRRGDAPASESRIRAGGSFDEGSVVIALALSEFARLIQSADGTLSVLLEGGCFAREDQLPRLLHGADAGRVARYSAESFVAECVIRQFGTDSHHWPEIARRFLFVAEYVRKDFSKLGLPVPMVNLHRVAPKRSHAFKLRGR